jgi:hypothetical protein
MKVIFCKEGISCNDFNLEEVFLELTTEINTKSIVKVANILLVDRFRLALVKKELPISEITFEVKDKNENLISETTSDGQLCEFWEVENTRININILLQLI